MTVLLTCYASFACLALAMQRHYRGVFLQDARPGISRLLRGTGWLLCFTGLMLCLQQAESCSLGLVQWFAALTGAAVAFIVLFAVAPRIAVAMCVPVMVGLLLAL